MELGDTKKSDYKLPCGHKFNHGILLRYINSGYNKCVICKKDMPVVAIRYAKKKINIKSFKFENEITFK